MKKLELYFIDLIQGKKKGFFAGIFKFILFVLSLIFQFIAKMRNMAFDRGILSKYRPPLPLIISVGNIVAGGTGKTPATILIANQFYQEFKIAILSRGYRSSSENESFPTFLSRGDGPLHHAAYCGDEPYLISESLPKAIVIVGKNRQEASNLAVKEGVHLIILDDGMQHRKLARDLEVVVMDASDLFGQGYFLPRGFLREDPSSLSRANLVMLNHIDHSDHFFEVKKQLLKYTQAPVVGCQVKVVKIFDLMEREIASLNGKKVGLFSAIAKPEKFKHTVLNEGAEILAEYFLPDHIAFDLEKLRDFSNKCKSEDVELLICTEKDRVKLSKYLDVSLPIASLKVELVITEGLDEWKRFVQKAKNDIMRSI